MEETDELISLISRKTNYGNYVKKNPFSCYINNKLVWSQLPMKKSHFFISKN